jgi:hypothetical protein
MLPTGAEITPEKAEQFRSMTKARDEAECRMAILMRPYATEYYCVVSEDDNPNPLCEIKDCVVAKGHPVYALFTVRQIRNPVFLKVVPLMYNYGESEPCPVGRNCLFKARSVVITEVCGLLSSEWSSELWKLLALWHPVWQVREFMVMLSSTKKHKALLQEISGERGDTILRIRWLAEQFLKRDDLYKDWIMVNCWLRVLY